MRRAVLFAICMLAAPFALVASVHADTANFIVTNFTADYYLGQSDPQGTLEIQEHLTVDFNDYNHGILRALPQKYNGHDEHLRIDGVKLDGHAEQYSTYTSNGNEVLKIGNPNATITGTHSYDINYHAQNVIRFTSGHDELDWNTNGTEWTQPFEAITARLHVPAALVTSLRGFNCYTGTQGSRSQDCMVHKTVQDATFTTTRPLNSAETMTFVTNFALGAFQKPTAADWWSDHKAAVLSVAVPPLVALLAVYPYWRRKGKDIKGRGTIIPEYTPPDGLHAAEADIITNYKLGTNAISATIIDLAIRKYLRITESENKGVLGIGKHTAYTFHKLPAPAAGNLKSYEQQIYAALFPAGDTTAIADLKNSFYVTKNAVEKELPAALTVEGYFPSNPRRAGSWLHVASVVVLLIGFVLTGSDWALRIGLVAAGSVSLGFAALMPRRTQKGVDAKDALAGLRLYMNVAEKDRIAGLQSAGAPYAPQSGEPDKTVKLFERLLPYAMILGVDKSWAKQFEGIYTTPPDWYGGNWTAFNAGYLVGALNNSMSAMNSSFAAPSSSGAGSGGGFAGGGGGGGGGGGW